MPNMATLDERETEDFDSPEYGEEDDFPQHIGGGSREGVKRPDRLKGFEPTDSFYDIDQLDTVLETVDSPEFRREDFADITDPHLLFSPGELLKALTPISSVIKSTQEQLSKSILVEPDSGFVLLKVNTGDYLIEAKVPYENKTNVLKDSFILEFKTFFHVVRNCRYGVPLVEKDGILSVNVLGGKVEFEKIAMDKSLFDKIPKELSKNSVSVPGETFRMFLIRSVKVMPLCSRLESRRIRCDSTGVYTNFLSSATASPSIGINCSFRAGDLSLLLKLVDGAKEIQFFSSEDINYFVISDFRVGLPKIDTKELEGVRQIIDSVKSVAEIDLNIDDFQTGLRIVRASLGASSVIKLIIENSVLTMQARSATNKLMTFPISTTISNQSFEVFLPSSMLVSVASLMRKESNSGSVTGNRVSLAKDKQLLFETDDIKILVGSFNRSTNDSFTKIKKEN